MPRSLFLIATATAALIAGPVRAQPEDHQQRGPRAAIGAHNEVRAAAQADHMQAGAARAAEHAQAQAQAQVERRAAPQPGLAPGGAPGIFGDRGAGYMRPPQGAEREAIRQQVEVDRARHAAERGSPGFNAQPTYDRAAERNALHQRYEADRARYSGRPEGIGIVGQDARDQNAARDAARQRYDADRARYAADRARFDAARSAARADGRVTPEEHAGLPGGRAQLDQRQNGVRAAEDRVRIERARDSFAHDRARLDTARRDAAHDGVITPAERTHIDGRQGAIAANRDLFGDRRARFASDPHLADADRARLVRDRIPVDPRHERFNPEREHVEWRNLAEQHGGLRGVDGRNYRHDVLYRDWHGDRDPVRVQIINRYGYQPFGHGLRNWRPGYGLGGWNGYNNSNIGWGFDLRFGYWYGPTFWNPGYDWWYGQRTVYEYGVTAEELVLRDADIHQWALYWFDRYGDGYLDRDEAREAARSLRGLAGSGRYLTAGQYRFALDRIRTGLAYRASYGGGYTDGYGGGGPYASGDRGYGSDPYRDDERYEDDGRPY